MLTVIIEFMINDVDQLEFQKFESKRYHFRYLL